MSDDSQTTDADGSGLQDPAQEEAGGLVDAEEGGALVPAPGEVGGLVRAEVWSGLAGSHTSTPK